MPLNKWAAPSRGPSHEQQPPARPCGRNPQAHADIQDAAKTVAQRAIDAGHALIEAKSLVKHGEWLPWLREHCALAERTAQLYMKIANSGLESATVADSGLNAAARVLACLPYPFNDPFNDGTEDQNREWLIFLLFLNRRCRWRVGVAADHCWWLRRRPFETPSEWLGPVGKKYHRLWGFRFSDDFEGHWLAFLEQHRGRTPQDIDTEIRAIAEAEPPEPVRRPRRRKAAA
jgi:hypothetical protein